MIRCRMATEEDIVRISEIRWTHEYEVEGPFEITKEEFVRICSEYLKEGLLKQEWVYWIAERNGLIVSTVFINLLKKPPKPQQLTGEIGYVTNVHTCLDYRRNGIGDELFGYVVKWAAERGLERLFLWPSDMSKGLYLKHGFQDKNEIMELQL